MAIQGEPMSVFAGVPVDEATRREATAVGKTNRANGNVRQDDRLALRKRPGFTALSNARSAASNRLSGLKLFAFNGNPCVIDANGNVDIYSEAKSTSFQAGRVSSATYSLKSIPSVSASDPVTDIEIVNGCMAIAYASGSLSVVDVSSGVTIAPILRGGNSSNISVTEVTSYGGQFFVAYAFDGPSGNLVPYTFDTNAPASGWIAQTTITGVTAMSSASAGSCSLLMYSTGGTTITITKYLVTGPGTSTTITGVTSVTGFDIVVSPDFSTMWLAYMATNITVQARLVATPATVVSTPTSVASLILGLVTLVAGDNNTSATLFISGVNGSNDRGIFVSDVTTSAGATVLSNNTRTFGVQVCGRGVRQNGRTLIPVYGSPDPNSGANLTATLTVVDATDIGAIGGNSFRVLAPVAHIEPGIVFFSSNGTIAIISNKLVYDAAGNLYCAFSSKSGGGIVPATYFGSTSVNNRVAVLSFSQVGRWQVAPHAHSVFLSGAVLNVFDGTSVTEAGFVVPPPQGVTSLTAGSLNGLYRYVATYESVDAAGNWAVSGVSPPIAVTTVNNTVTITYSPLSVTQRNGKNTTRLTIYRTLTGGAPPYYRLGVVANNPSPITPRLTFTDNLSDASISSGTKLYAPNLPGTAGESLDRRAPPGLVDVVSYNGMLVGIKGESVINSGQLVYGESVWFNPVFETVVSGGGDLVALCPQDGTLYLFKADRIFAVSGEEPSDNGLQGGLGQPRLLACDVGCIDANSVVPTSLGIFFRSSRGIELLDRTGAVQFVGNDIYRTVDAYPITTSAVLDERNGLVRFSLAASQSGGLVSGAGVDVVYDLTLQAWVSVDTKTGSSSSEASQSAAVVRNRSDWRYAWLGTNGTVYVEKDLTDSDACLDGTTWVQSTWELPPWNLGIQREQVVYESMILIDRADAAGLSIEEADDYSTTYAPLHTWSETETLAQVQLPFRPKTRTTAIQLRVRDTAPVTLGTGKGITFIGMTFDVGANQGPNRGTPRLAGSLRK